MRYTHILELIDADLHRLQMARELLIDSSAFRRSRAQQSASQAAVSAFLSESSVVSDHKPRKKEPSERHTRQDRPMVAEVMASLPGTLEDLQVAGAPPISNQHGNRALHLPAATHATRVRDEKMPAPAKRSTQKRRSRKSSSEATALGGVVPVGPVFIPGEIIRQEKATRERDKTHSHKISRPTEEIPFTAESLAQRWLGSRAS